MPPFETRSSQFGLVSGIRQPSSDMVLVAEPAGLFAPEARKGQLYIVAEADQDVARGRDACQLIGKTIRRVFYEDSTYSVTSALRKAISAANKALYEHNFSVAAQKRAVVGVTCAVIKGNDLYLAQILPAQVYVLAGGKLRAIPSNPAWNPNETRMAAFIKPGALGASLSVEPEFYRAVLGAGDALLLCSSNLSRLLGQDDVLRLLRAPDPAWIADGLVAICKEHALPEAHGIAAAARARLSPSAQAAPLSRAGISERGMAALHGIGGWASRVTGEAAMLVKGPAARTQKRKTESRIEQARREEARLAELPAEPPDQPKPPATVRPLDLGMPLEQRRAQERRERSERLGAPPRRSSETNEPPSVFLGEGSYVPPPDRRIDLSDTPSMAAIGRTARGHGSDLPPLAPTIGERLAQPFTRIAAAASSFGHRRRLRRPPPSAMSQGRRRQGLSYRRQGPPFPWQLLLLLVALVALAVLYGINLSRESTQRQADNSLEKADQAINQLRNADDASAQSRLEAASVALAEVRSTGAVTATLENRQRYDELQREYERALAAIQKQTYFDDLTVIARHPTPGGLFGSVVVPPPPQGITNTAAFQSIYMLDNNAGVLYRMLRTGGPIEPIIKPTDTVGPLVVGQIKAQAWREDNIVAVSQNGESGPFTFYYRNGDNWGYNALAGSETWIRAGPHFRAVNYGGNLYIWDAGAAPDQVQKYLSGRYGEFPDPWIKDAGNQKTANSIDLAVDGDIYLLKPDGHILVFEGGVYKREIVPQGINPPINVPASFFVTGDPETGSIFMIDYNQRVLEINKQTGALIQQVRARPDSANHLDQLTSLYVDASGARPVLYLVNGGQILRGSLPDRPQPFRPSGTPGPSGTTTPRAATAAPAPTSAP
jgi:tetratricopeptide (TPR) repeat protein